MSGVLITCFEPFDRFKANPSMDIAEHLSKEHGGAQVLILPVVYGEAGRRLIERLEGLRPDLILSFGLNPTIGHINIEELAVNIRASEVPDNKGTVISDQPVDPQGPLALRTGLPAGSIVEVLRGAGIPAKRSFSAGVYLCNEVYYTALSWCRKNGGNALFVHVPLATHMVEKAQNDPHMPISDLKKAAGMVLDASMGHIR